MRLFSGFKEENKEEKRDKSNMIVTVNESRCPQNHHCPSVQVCPVGALSQNGFHAPQLDEEKCIKCGKCVRFCPKRALVMK
jgi:ferredoxin